VINPLGCKNTALKSKYGITFDDYCEIHRKQNGLCAICGQVEQHPNKLHPVGQLNIDHDHNTGVVRGLLCGKCNKGIGLFDDNVELLDKAKEYIIKHKKG
jgi:hypothetical protein